MAKKQQLVTQHLEDISWEVMDKYPKILKEFIRGRYGVYALYRRDKLYYVGLASNLMTRLNSHLKDRHKGAWDRFSVYLTVHNEHIKELESLILRIADPPGNRVKGKFSQSDNLLRKLNREIIEMDSDNRAKLLGGRIARGRHIRKARKARGKGALNGLVTKRMILKAWYKGYEYTASLRRDGTIQYDGKIYDSPNEAGKAAVGRGVYGWGFWKYKQAGEWIKLLNIKK